MRVLVNNKLFRNGALFSIFSFLNSGISFLLLFVLANYFSPEEYGYLNLFTTITTVFSLLVTLNTNGFFSISYFRVSEETLKRIISCVLVVSFIVSFFFGVLIICFSSISSKIIGIGFQYQLIALIICFFQVFITLKLEIWRLEERPISYGVFTFGIAVFSAIFALYFVIKLDMGWLGRVYSQLLIIVSFFIISATLLIKEGYITRLEPTKKIMKEALLYGVPLVPHSLSTWIRQGLDRYIINLYLGVTEVGYFSFAFNIYNIILMIGTAFNATNSVHLFKILSEVNKDEAEVKRKLRKQIKLMCVFFLAIALIIIMCSYIFIPIVFPQYNPSIPYLFPLVAAGFFQCLYFLFVNFLFFYKKTKKLMIITISVSVFHLLLSLAFTRFGMIYTAYISLFSNFLICLFVIIYSNRYLNFNLRKVV
ncbi:lipopolysaccharide biosynthesis protein [Dysgonomonas sp. HGC4]|uniref:lipopolysaccharide biosynthesis protein n=1 Tax=Dysgonomonas sp. HGC4 TaxID=1658009 RepID=UPI0012F82983|nr:oligosaccharide flippase family protein [Dysgonomonas sp. HGC4]MBD8349067.1 oligosaccharide flippase family protein [Dysgonomonas sp. HGC4]